MYLLQRPTQTETSLKHSGAIFTFALWISLNQYSWGNPQVFLDFKVQWKPLQLFNNALIGELINWLIVGRETCWLSTGNKSPAMSKNERRPCFYGLLMTGLINRNKSSMPLFKRNTKESSDMTGGY